MIASQHARTPYYAVLAIAILLYSVYFSIYQIQRHRAFQTSLDLVSVEQPLWNTLHGNFMRTTYYPVTGQLVSSFDQTPSENLLADHFQPSILVLLLPYAIFPSSETLMILLSVSVALGAIPVYRLAVRRLKHPAWGMAFSIAYLLLPAVQTNTGYDIHLTNFLPPLLLFALDAMESGPTWLWIVFSLLAMGCREDMLLLTGWGMLLLAPKARQRGAIGILLAGLVIGICFYGLIIPNFGGQSESTYLSRMFPRGTELNGQGIAAVISQPGYWKSVFVHLLGYNLRLGLPFLFLFWLHPASALAAAPIILQNSFSWWSAQWDPNSFHYSAPIVPFIFIGVIEGLRILAAKLRPFRQNYKWESVIGVALFTSIAASQWMAGYTPLANNFKWPELTGREETLLTLLENIPLDANLSADPRLAGHLARRPMLRFFPDMRDADWVVVDAWLGNYPYYKTYAETLQTWQSYLTDPTWETAFAESGIIVLRKEVGPPLGIEAAFKPTTNLRLRAIQVEFTNQQDKLQLLGGEFVPLTTGQYAFCTDWLISRPGMNPTIEVIQPRVITERPLTGLSFFPGLFTHPGRIRDCSPILLAGNALIQVTIQVTDPSGTPLSVNILDSGEWSNAIQTSASSITFTQSER